ncbi:MAG: type I glutamate--ammonia ligase [Phycisphaerales bacterium]|nr:MAG: type I glutamate--ammonia ligase [Phycisphaerales bacterium]
MFDSVKSALEYLRKNDVAMVDLKIVGMSGEWLHVSIPRREFTEKFFVEGVGYDGSSVPGFSTLESGDLAAMPDATTGFVDPFFERPTLSFICNTVTADTKEPYDKDPRGVGQRAEALLAQSGVADRALFGPEFEFNVFDGIHIQDDPYHTAVRILADRDIDEGVGFLIPAQRGYMRTPPLDWTHNLRTKICEMLEEMGVPVHYHHHEVGAAGQCEIEIAMGTLTKVADHTMLIKYVTKNVARMHKKIATFMPKPVYAAAGNGMHVHQKLDLGDKRVFYDETGRNYARLSDLALQYISGLLLHGRALTGLTNPSTNSFKRLVPGYEAPVNLFFSEANRSAAIRVPRYATSPEDKRIEYRPPDFTGNIYLTLASMLMAGLDGVRRKIRPEEHDFGPYDVDMATAKELQAKIAAVPASVREAMRALSEDREFLLAGGVFSNGLIDSWIELKLDREARAVELRPHPYEYQLYLDT